MKNRKSILKHEYPKCFLTLKDDRRYCRFMRNVYNIKFSNAIFKL